MLRDVFAVGFFVSSLASDVNAKLPQWMMMAKVETLTTISMRIENAQLTTPIDPITIEIFSDFDKVMIYLVATLVTCLLIFYRKCRGDGGKVAPRGSQSAALLPQQHLLNVKSDAVSDAVPREDWGRGPIEPSIPDLPVHDLLLAGYATSGAPALWVEGEKQPVSFMQLLGDAKGIAQQLLAVTWPEIEAGKPRIVPLLLRTRDGYETVVGALGVLMAGAAFSALDIEALPEDRLVHMLAVIDAPVALTSDGARPFATNTLGCRAELLVVQSLSKFAPATTADLPMVSSQSAMALYWTSGSTGKPKGVLISAAAALSHYMYYLPQFHIGPGSRVLRTTAISFDVTFSIVFGSLLSGAMICWPTGPVLKDPSAMVDVCEKYSVNFLCTVPSSLSLFLERDHFPRCVDHVGCAGEALHWSLVDSLRGPGKPSLHNRYGPTECGNISTMKCNVGGVTCPMDATVPVGSPCAHRELHLVDWDGGARGEGELWITGPGLSFGYLGQPELTDLSFQPLPECARGPSGRPGCRAYKTGDVLRWNTAGELIFCGRTDHQVKIRGQRVELSEIEGLFKSSDYGVTESVVVIEGTGSSVALTAFVSPSSVDVAKLAQLAAAKLPSYMVPRRILIVDEWPKGTTGKIDRKSLTQRAMESSTGNEEGGVVMELDSLGQMRMRRARLDGQEVTLLANMRMLLALGMLQDHFFNVSCFAWNASLPWSATFAGPIALKLGLVGILTAPLGCFDKTSILLFMVGFQDSLDLNPFAPKVRDWIMVPLALCSGMLLPFFGLPCVWWSVPFFLVRLVTCIGGLGGRFGKWGRVRFVLYLAWSIHQAYYWYSHDCSNGAVTIGPVYGCVGGDASDMPGYFWVFGAQIGSFGSMYWIGLEGGSFLRRWLHRQFHTIRQMQCRPLWALVSGLTFVVMCLFGNHPALNKFSPWFPNPGYFLIIASMAYFLLLAVPVGWHLPSTWALPAILFTSPSFFVQSGDASYDVYSLIGTSSNPWYATLPPTWTITGMLILYIWVVIIGYYVLLGLLTHELSSVLARMVCRARSRQ